MAYGNEQRMWTLEEYIKEYESLEKQRDALLVMCTGLLGAMPPALQKKWPNIVKGAKAAIAKAQPSKQSVAPTKSGTSR